MPNCSNAETVKGQSCGTVFAVGAFSTKLVNCSNAGTAHRRAQCCYCVDCRSNQQQAAVLQCRSSVKTITLVDLCACTTVIVSLSGMREHSDNAAVCCCCLLLLLAVAVGCF